MSLSFPTNPIRAADLQPGIPYRRVRRATFPGTWYTRHPWTVERLIKVWSRRKRLTPNEERLLRSARRNPNEALLHWHQRGTDFVTGQKWEIGPRPTRQRTDVSYLGPSVVLVSPDLPMRQLARPPGFTRTKKNG